MPKDPDFCKNLAPLTAISSLCILSVFFLVSPLLAIWSTWPVCTLVVLVLHLVPVGREHCAARRLIALNHGTSSVFVLPPIDVLEEAIESILSFRFVILELLFDLLVQLIPVYLLLGARGIGWLRTLRDCSRSRRCRCSPRGTGFKDAPIDIRCRFL